MLSEKNLKPEIVYCEKHRQEKGVISMDRIVDNNGYLKVYFETLKCVSCSNLSDQIYKCPNCSSFYCKDCMVYQKDSKIAIFCSNKPSCRVCLHSFADFPYQLSKFDHFRVKDTENEAIKKYTMDRNIAKIIQEDIKISCHYSDCGAECKLNQGSYESITRHQVDCRACEDCLYYCPSDKCTCGQYFKKNDLKTHIDAI